jgi:hypothetical protein
MRRAILAVLSLASACGEVEPPALPAPDASTAAPDAGPGDAPDAGPPLELDAPLFPRDRAVRIELEVAPADWDALRRQTRSLETTLARESCLEENFDSPFTYFPARARIDGVEHPEIGLRKRGFLGSLSELTPSLKLKLDHLRDGAAHLGRSTLLLNNGRQDPSRIRACLAYDVMRAAGVPAPRCGWAEVVVNGTSLGPYAHVEAVDRSFLRRVFGEDDGQLYEGTLSDFRSGWMGTFEQETRKSTPYDRSDLEALRAALERPDAELLEALEPLVDLEAFLRFWAAEALVGQWDGYSSNANNFHVYRRGDGRFVFIPWGLDAPFGINDQEPRSVRAEARLPRRLYLHPEGRQRYLSQIAALLDGWDVEATVRELDRAAGVVAPLLARARAPQATEATRALREHVLARPSLLDAELSRGGAAWEQPERPPLCFALEPLEARLTTRFGTHPAPDLFATGTGTFTATVAGTLYRGARVGAAAGFGEMPDDAEDVVLVLAALTRARPIPVLYVALRPELFVEGATIPFDGVRARGALLSIPRPGAPLELVGGLFEGEVRILRGRAEAGAEVEAEVVARALRQR